MGEGYINASFLNTYKKHINCQRTLPSIFILYIWMTLGSWQLILGWTIHVWSLNKPLHFLNIFVRISQPIPYSIYISFNLMTHFLLRPINTLGNWTNWPMNPFKHLFYLTSQEELKNSWIRQRSAVNGILRIIFILSLTLLCNPISSIAPIFSVPFMPKQKKKLLQHVISSSPSFLLCLRLLLS